KKDFDCWHNQLNCGTHRDSLVNFTPLGVTTQEYPAFRHGECQNEFINENIKGIFLTDEVVTLFKGYI
ncbi:hypothetical protein O0536_16480, partial [Brevibacillus laterosporus]